MRFLRASVLLLFCAVGVFSCRSSELVGRSREGCLRFAFAESDSMRFGFDWRMGLTDSLRAGSALFFRFELLPETAREVKNIYVVDKYASQIGVDYSLRLVEGQEKSIGIIAFAPEASASLPAGVYDIALEIQLSNGSQLSSKLLSFSLLPRDYALSSAALAEERRRFAAFLQLNNDKRSYDAVAPIVVEPASQENILARLLRFYDLNIQYPSTGEPEQHRIQELSTWSRDTALSVRERELSILALDEVYTRSRAQIRSGK